MKVIEVTGSADVTGINQLIICSSANPLTLTLTRTAAGTCGGYYIKNVGSGTVTVTPVLNDLIDGAATRDLLTHEAILIMDYGANSWIVISNNYIP